MIVDQLSAIRNCSSFSHLFCVKGRQPAPHNFLRKLLSLNCNLHEFADDLPLPGPVVKTDFIGTVIQKTMETSETGS